MSKIGIVYWSGTGNTQAMALAIAEGIKSSGHEVEVFEAIDFSPTLIPDYSAIAFGCPSMGSEELESDDFEPMFNSCLPALTHTPIALFGSYGWGSGEWMESWKALCHENGVKLIQDSLIVNDAPSPEDISECERFGKVLATSSH